MSTRDPRARNPEPPSPVPGGGPALIAGYRVLRRLGSSDRADLYVGVASPWSTPPGRERHGQGPGDHPAPVVLKVFLPGTESLSVDREVRALTTLTPGRLTALVDVGTLSDGRTCLVLEQLTGGALSGFLEGRQRIGPGEAVTILAPVAAALAELQAIGLMHAAVNLSTILFDSSGRPVLTGLGQLRPLPDADDGRPEAVDAVDAAHGRLAQVVRAVLDHVDPGLPAPTALRDLERWCTVPAARSTVRAPGELEHLLFAWAEAVPVRLGQTRAAGRGPQVGDWLRRPPPDDPAGREHGEVDRLAAGESGVWRMLARRVSRSRAAVHRRWIGIRDGELKKVRGRGFRARGGPLLLAAVVAVVSTGLAVTTVNPGMSKHDAGGRSAASTESGDSSGVPSDDPAEPSGSDTDGADRAAVLGDDPAVAVPALLRIRARCLREVSVVCLDDVHQSQSAALAADSHTLRLMEQGGVAPEQEDLWSWAAALVERTGDVALVSLQAPAAERQPASVLVVKGEAGWRVRDIFDY